MTEQYLSLDNLYENREKFILIGLTGRTGSGCSTAAELLTNDIKKLKLPKPQRAYGYDNEGKKYEIIYNFAKKNWKKYRCIQMRDVITSFIVENDFNSFSSFVECKLGKTVSERRLINEKLKKSIKSEYTKIHNERLKIKRLREETENKDVREVSKIEKRRHYSHEFYFVTLPSFTSKLKKILSDLSEDSYTTIYQLIGDNIRSSGKALDDTFEPENKFRLAIRVNKLIKMFRELSVKSGENVCIVIDAIRNPYEAIFFRERYAAFYLMAINTENGDRIRRLQKINNLNDKQIELLDKKEYSSKLKGNSFFYSQNIPKCIQLADIHINNPQIGNDDLTTLKTQLARYISLIMHPGLIVPSRAERCMQIAHTAKLNSGCLSRQVGAVVADENYSVKSVGWNTSPEGQTACMLRNVENLMNHDDKEAYSDYENNDQEYREVIEFKYREKMDSPEIKKILRGRNVSYCFKDIRNEIDDDDNQVHTRSLHGEENAFLQLTKYGTAGIKGGILFTTASPCVLCAKKAYQLGITKIYYIDPYPDIALDHILKSGSKPPTLELFHGAIGRAYTQLYEPIISYKDELNMILNIAKRPKKEVH